MRGIEGGGEQEIGALTARQLHEVGRGHEPAQRVPIREPAIVMLDQDVMARVWKEGGCMDVGKDLGFYFGC